MSNQPPYQNWPPDPRAPSSSGTGGYPSYPDAGSQQYAPPPEYGQSAPGYTPPTGYGQSAPGYGLPPGYEQPAPAYMPPEMGYPPPLYPGMMQRDPGKGLAITGFVLGIVGVVLSWFPILGIILAVLGIIFSAVGQKSVTSRGLAIAGLVLSIAATVLAILFMFLEHII